MSSDLDFNDLYPSRFLSAPDVKKVGGRLITTITDVSREDIGGQLKAVLGLRDDKLSKPMVCNRTNGNFLREALGDRAASWIGAKISIEVERVQFGRELKDGIRIKKAVGPQTATVQTTVPSTPTLPPAVGGGGVPDDDIPFGPWM